MRMVVLAAGAGRRLRRETAGGPKQLVEVGGRSMLDRLLELGASLRLAPLVLTRQAQAARFEALGVEVLVVEETTHMLDTLCLAHRRVAEDFVWIGGDTLFADGEPVRDLLASHRAERPYASFLYRRSDRHLAKMLPSSPVPRVTLTRQGDFPFSLPNLGIQCAASFADLAIEPRGEFVQRALDRGERILFREYRAPVFEIDTPEDLAAARRHFS
ncbi:MAG TPA: NTP transferase domain-containing protein [Thermoanaerobaculia bacterium]|nr:NTP transferase domain-containing protein [Thermoanaerobaculia bacterium]